MTTTRPELVVLSDPPATPRFPTFPPRDDLQNYKLLHDYGHVGALRRRLGSELTTVVYSELPLGWNHRRQRGMRVPDILVAFNVNRNFIVADGGYSIEDHGKPPEFVLEIASPTTSRNDETVKRRDYANFRVIEYWRFDDTEGKLYRAALAGDRLVNGEYEPIEVVEVSWARIWGYSAVLNLYVCWEYGYLRWYDPVTQRYLCSYDEEADQRIAAQTELATEREARISAEAELGAEQAARIVAEARIRQLEEQLRRQRENETD